MLQWCHTALNTATEKHWALSPFPLLFSISIPPSSHSHPPSHPPLSPLWLTFISPHTSTPPPNPAPHPLPLSLHQPVSEQISQRIWVEEDKVWASLHLSFSSVLPPFLYLSRSICLCFSSTHSLCRPFQMLLHAWLFVFHCLCFLFQICFVPAVCAPVIYMSIYPSVCRCGSAFIKRWVMSKS